MKHGTQKWKTRGRVGKDNTQTWDNQKIVFKALIGEMVSNTQSCSLSLNFFYHSINF